MESKPLKLYDLRTYKEYRRLVLPLKDEERKRMEADIAHSAIQKPISIWSGRILVDYERYALFQRLQIPFAITNISAKSGEEAIDWICRDQLQRTDLTKEMRKYLIGRRCLARKIIDSHYAMSQPISRALRSGEPKYETSLVRIRERLGAEYHIDQATVRQYADFTDAIDVIRRSAPELAQSLLTGRLTVSYGTVLGLAALSPPELQEVDTHLEDISTAEDMYSYIKSFLPAKQKSPIPSAPIASVKDMPGHDPDAEIAILTLTIPSWRGSVQRIIDTADFEAISSEARNAARQELLVLKDLINEILFLMKGELPNG